MASVEFFGEQFGLNAEVSEFSLMEFAEAAADGLDANAMAGMAAMMRLIKECIVTDDVSRFLKSARKNRAGSEDLIPILKATFEQVTERPTGLPSDSSDGQSATVPSSVVSAVDKGLERLAGRPDLQLAVLHSRSA
jgi:hypothetical protein